MRSFRQSDLIPLIGLLSAFLFASCATTKPTESLFLKNQSQLVENGKIKSYTNPQLQTSKLKKVHLSPVVLQLEKEAFSEEKRNELVTYYETELKTAFGSHYQLVNAPARDAYTVRSAITGLNSANVFTNAVLSIVAVPLDNGGASAETEILKGTNNERLYAESRSIAGGLTGKGSLASKTFGYLSSTNHAKSALKNVAEELVKVLPKN